ncbi:MAG: hypothetical protein GX564_09250 [Oligosphaeraceae bacterium]|nr:hypothetical protein [Oligosphaeraceae bacterium]
MPDASASLSDRLNAMLNWLCLARTCQCLAPVFLLWVLGWQIPAAKAQMPIWACILGLTALLLLAVELLARAQQVLFFRELWHRLPAEQSCRWSRLFWLYLLPPLDLLLLPPLILAPARRRGKAVYAAAVLLAWLRAGTCLLGGLLLSVSDSAGTAGWFAASSNWWGSILLLLLLGQFLLLLTVCIRLAEAKVQPRAWATAGLLLLAALSAYFVPLLAITVRESQAEAIISDMHSRGLPVRLSLAEIEDAYYAGREPNPDFVSYLENPPAVPALPATAHSSSPWPLPPQAAARLSGLLQELTAVFTRDDALAQLEPPLKSKRNFQDPFSDDPISDFSTLRGICKRYTCRIIAALDQGDPAQAWALCQLNDRICETLRQDCSTLTAYLVSDSCDSQSLGSLQRILSAGQLTEAELTALALELQDREKRCPARLSQVLGSEVAFGRENFIQVFHTGGGSNRRTVANFWSAFFQQDYVTYLKTMREMLEYAGQGQDYWKTRQDGRLQQLLNLRADLPAAAILTKMLVPTLPLVMLKSHTRQATLRLAIVALEVEKYRRQHQGNPPASLEALPDCDLPVDPFTGRAFNYTVGLLQSPPGSGDQQGEVTHQYQAQGYRLSSAGAAELHRDKPQWRCEFTVLTGPVSTIPAD